MYFNYICLPPPLLLTPSKLSSVPLPNPVFLFQWPTESVLSTHIPAVWLPTAPELGLGLSNSTLTSALQFDWRVPCSCYSCCQFIRALAASPQFIRALAASRQKTALDGCPSSCILPSVPSPEWRWDLRQMPLRQEHSQSLALRTVISCESLL